jgi:DNA-binding transcriptional ArsR family regulator
MVVDNRHADLVFRALSDSTRRDILRRTMLGEHSVTALANHYPMSFAAIQKHVAVLERARLVAKRREGREHLVRANIETVRVAQALLDRFEETWKGRIERFGEVLAEMKQGANQ